MEWMDLEDYSNDIKPARCAIGTEKWCPIAVRLTLTPEPSCRVPYDLHEPTKSLKYYTTLPS